MQKNIGTYQRFVRAGLGILLLWIGTYGIVHPLGRVAILVAGVWLIAEAVLGICPLFYVLGIKTTDDTLRRRDVFLLFALGVQAVVVFEWWRAAFGKLTNDFESNFPTIVQFYATESNPFPRVANALQHWVLPNADLFVQLVQWGQVAVAFGLMIGGVTILWRSRHVNRFGYVLSIIALAFGVVMNAIFWLSAGWTGAGTAELNVVMFWVQILLMYVWGELLSSGEGNQDSDVEVSGQFIYEEHQIYEINQ